MSEHTHILEPYKTPATRHTCPACGQKKVFAKYINSLTGEYLADHVGRCNREVNCGYHYTPKHYFQENPDAKEIPVPVMPVKPTVESKPVSFIEDSIVQASFQQKAYEVNRFVLFLMDRFGAKMAEDMVKKFSIGNSKFWNGATVFWQIDREWRTHAGKVMQYDRSTGKRVKSTQPDGSKKVRITWVHSILKNNGMEQYQNFNLSQCLFGEHQLATEPEDKPVGIVESEKTAIIASIYKPELIWMACGGLSNISAQILKPLQGRKVVLFPDLNAYDKWVKKVQDIPSAVVSNLLEKIATEEERASGLDLADYLLRFNYLEFWTYPKDWDDVTPIPGYEDRKHQFTQHTI